MKGIIGMIGKEQLEERIRDAWNYTVIYVVGAVWFVCVCVCIFFDRDQIKGRSILICKVSLTSVGLVQ